MAQVATHSGHHAVTPYLLVADAERLVGFLTEVFEGQETNRTMRSDGKIAHAEVKVSGSTVMLGEISTEWQPMAASVYVYVNDTDRTYERAVRAGSVSYMEPADLSPGNRMAAAQDPFGNVWWIVTYVELGA